ncbi:MAG TPA: tetratricopeptide repeat protein [Polyangiaceae bacterium]|nr:tetratricopeptide repeat protein [Polyangiaceae bacterium]
MRKKCAAAGAIAVALALGLVVGGSGEARAQTQGGAAQGKPQQPLILQKVQLGSAGYTTVARARMRNGDCAGAVDAFDEAVKHSIDPTLRRDRGLCHEQLGHPYPAIDDYRVYLAAEPDAPDAQSIQARLDRLEQQTTGRSESSEANDDTSVLQGSVSVNGSTATASESATTTPVTRDTMDYVEHDNEQLRSPLRRGKGWSFAPFFAERKWFITGTNFGDAQTWAEAVGLQFRYSFGHVSTLFLEGGYTRFNSTAATAGLYTLQGMTSQLGLEFRFPFDPEYDNQLIVAPGLGFEYWVETANVAGASSVDIGMIMPRVRVGWRHMLAVSAALDLSLDAGFGKPAQFSNPSNFPFGGNADMDELVALNVGLVWGL